MFGHSKCQCPHGRIGAQQINQNRKQSAVAPWPNYIFRLFPMVQRSSDCQRLVGAVQIKPNKPEWCYIQMYFDCYIPEFAMKTTFSSEDRSLVCTSLFGHARALLKERA